MSDRHSVFLSFASKDAGHAAKLRRLLSARPDTRLVSSEDFGVGENWQVKLREAVANCDLFVLVLSPETLASSWVLKELGAAWALEKRILAVVAGTALPMSLPVELEERQFAYLRDLRKPEDFDPWFAPAEATVAA
jgi:hypothetical protein